MKKFGGSWLPPSIAIIFCLGTVFQAFAQPTNDFCTNAVDMSMGTVYAIDTSTATSTGDPTNICSAPFGKGVWFRFTTTRTGTLTLNTCGSDFDTVIGIFTGSCDALTFYSCADDNGPVCAGAQASISFAATAYTSFYIVVGGREGAGGNLKFTASISPPPNDTCETAIPLTNAVPYQINMIGATSSGDPRNCQFNTSPGVWFQYTPTNTGPLTISTTGTQFNPDIEVFTGACGNLTNPICGGAPTMHFPATNGITYRIFVSDYNTSGALEYSRNTELRIQVEEGTLPNDSCSGAVSLTNGVPYFIDTVTANSTNDPAPMCMGYASSGGVTWYTFTPESNGIVTISTCGSDYPSALQVYTGDCNSLVPLPDGCDFGNGPVCPGSASLNFETAGGIKYYILAAGVSGMVGNLEIQATLSPPSPNDHCQNAVPMQEGIVYTQNTVTSTTNGDPLLNFPIANGVWYTFTPPNSGIVTISTCGSDFPTALQVYSGNCNALSPVTEGGSLGSISSCPTFQAAVGFEGTGGVTYYVLVGSYGTLAGNLQIQAALSPSLNDHCENAIAMQDGIIYTRNTDASTTAGDPTPSCVNSFGKGVWYTYTPASNGIVTVSTCGSDFNTALQVYSGHCGALTAPLDSCNNGLGAACASSRASVVFEGVAGSTYYILVGGQGAATGNLQIQATLGAPLPNDHCHGAIALTNGVTYTENTVTATSTDDPMSGFGKGVWFSFTPATDGVVAVNTCGTDYSPLLQIFIGDCNSLTPLPDEDNEGNGPACAGAGSSILFLGKAGTNYLIFVNGSGGSLLTHLQIQATLHPALPNDQCSGAIDISEGGSYLIDTTFATDTGDYANGCAGPIKGVWYSLTPRASNVFVISLESTNVYPALQIFEGTCGQLTNVLCTFDFGGAPYTSLTITGLVGRTYLIQAGGISGTVGNLKMTASTFPPPNDQCFNAIRMLPGLKYQMNNAYASSTNDPVPLCDATAGHGIWYLYAPPTDAGVTVETCDSDFETVLQVYSGDCSSLTPVTCNAGFGPACATNRASVSFAGKAGTIYYILAAGKNGAFGNLRISVNGPPPANDTCEGAIDMTEGVPQTADTTYASSTDDAFPVTKGVWYRFTPTRAGFLLVNTCGSDFQTAFNVYTGACNSLTFYSGGATAFAVPCAGNRANAEFSVLPGITYYIDAGGTGLTNAGGYLSIIATMPPPTNDTCAGAIALSNGSVSQMNTGNATEAGDPTPLCQTNFGKGVWFTFTPPMSGTVSISTCKGDFDTVLQVYTGGCGALLPLANSCNDDAGPDCDSFTASVHFHGDAGVTYWILVGGYGGAGGNLAIEANVLPVLTLERAGTNAILSWPDNLSGYHPEFTTNLTPPIFWQPVPIIIGSGYQDGNFRMTNSIPGNAIYYRLKK
jgi:hypothetical protein